MTTSETQDCRDCGKSFPYDPDADRCPECIAANTEPTQDDRTEVAR